MNRLHNYGGFAWDREWGAMEEAKLLQSSSA
jgi:hypothetical protein